MHHAAEDQAQLDRRTFAMGVINGSLFNASARLMDATVVLSPLAERLVGSDTLVGLLQVASKIGWMWPTLFMPFVLEGVGRRLPWYRASAAVRMVAVWGAALVLLSRTASESPRVTFSLLAISLFLGSTFGGISWIPFMDIIAKGVPANKRGLLWGLRQGLAGVLGVGFATLAAYVLSPSVGLPFPRSYGWLFLIAAVVQTLALSAFCLAREPVAPNRPRRMTLEMHMWRHVRILSRDQAFRDFALSRISIGVALMGMEFLAICAHKSFGFTHAQTNAWLLPISIADAIYPFLWGFLCDRFGSRALLRTTGALVAFHAVLPLIALTLNRSHGLVSWHANLMLASSAVLAYAAASSNMIASSNFVLEVARPHQRDAYLGLYNSITTPLAFTSLLAGAISEHISYDVLYAVCLAASIGSIWLVYRRIPEPRGSAEPDASRRTHLLDQVRTRMWPKPGRRA